jgi:mannose-1-phosphate guanylyltransferase/mannose-6-phosphate isomerase
MRLVPAILCGGAGSRLWPVSRELHPKPFIRLADGQSLLQKAFLRGARLPGVAEVLTVTNRELFFKTRDEYREVDPATPLSFILEPFGRGTAAAVACAAIRVAAMHGREALVLILPADHLIEDMKAFTAAVSRACELANAGRLVTFGITPSSPETGYGYIEAQGNEVVRFVEKPSLDKAREFLSSGRFLWNSGMFCFAAGAVLDEMQRHSPAILAAARRCMDAAPSVDDRAAAQLELPAEAFAGVPEDSFDYAVMEKSDKVAVVPCDIGWSDIGSWTAIGALTAADESGNRVEGESVLHDVHDSYIRGGHRMIGAVGLSNVVIVDTPDALLVAHASRAQEVKHLYARLKERGHEAHKLHRTVHRPWGTYTVLEEGPGFKIKRIEVKPGASLSLQMHHQRSEHWIVVSGTALVVNGERELTVNVNESTFIPARNRHRLANPHDAELVIIEVQSGAYLGEDDIVRFDDQYGRVKAVHG